MEIPEGLQTAFEELCAAQRHYLGVKMKLAPESEIIEAMIERERARAKFDQHLDTLPPQQN